MKFETFYYLSCLAWCWGFGKHCTFKNTATLFLGDKLDSAGDLGTYLWSVLTLFWRLVVKLKYHMRHTAMPEGRSWCRREVQIYSLPYNNRMLLKWLSVKIKKLSIEPHYRVCSKYRLQKIYLIGKGNNIQLIIQYRPIGTIEKRKLIVITSKELCWRIWVEDFFCCYTFWKCLKFKLWKRS